jgi:hypothetical protein
LVLVLVLMLMLMMLVSMVSAIYGASWCCRIAVIPFGFSGFG